MSKKNKVLIGIAVFLTFPYTWFLYPFAYIGYKLYENSYFKGEQFNSIKSNMVSYVTNCNELNEHIEELKSVYSGIEQINYGSAEFKDSSNYNFKRKEQVKAQRSSFVYDCSATVCKNAGTQPFKYICKYFNIDTNEESLSMFEGVLNDFAAAEEGKKLLVEELDQIKESLSSDVPLLIKTFSMKKFMSKLGFEQVDLSNLHFPVYSFRYVSSGGNKSNRYDIRLDVTNLNHFVEYLSNLVKFRKSAAGQRALMTSKLREFIKHRDGHTCKKCGVSTTDEPHLLLEIDHIIPIAKGGFTEESNLQTLCWKCNRTKGAKLESQV